jgi:hypothetical protein
MRKIEKSSFRWAIRHSKSCLALSPKVAIHTKQAAATGGRYMLIYEAKGIGHSVTGGSSLVYKGTGQGEGFRRTVRDLNTHVRDTTHPAKRMLHRFILC